MAELWRLLLGLDVARFHAGSANPDLRFIDFVAGPQASVGRKFLRHDDARVAQSALLVCKVGKGQDECSRRQKHNCDLQKAIEFVRCQS